MAGAKPPLSWNLKAVTYLELFVTTMEFHLDDADPMPLFFENGYSFGEQGEPILIDLNNHFEIFYWPLERLCWFELLGQ
jgi:hypothetical protein